jgi:hypothetical protein
MNIQELGWEVDWVDLAQEKRVAGFCECDDEIS